ncbi:hypothetical protein ACT3RN_16310, partial [Psychrobacter sp. AOP5-GZ1-6]|uniref:hypothetical protein n=1 Tax=Psychrobacter sp. AOP5-GZ1-6 TaxID=3457649 RepID=UPI00402BBB0B
YQQAFNLNGSYTEFGMVSGDLIQDIKKQADDNNFEYSENIQSKVLISDTRTMGRSTCFIS